MPLKPPLPPRAADPLHGVTLEMAIEHLVERYGWSGLGDRIVVRCFTHEPSVSSSLKFLRRTPWARAKVESLYVHSVSHPRKTKLVPHGGETGLVAETAGKSSDG